MAETISMPKLGFDMAEGTLVRWVKSIGEPIEKGEVLAEIETDKATVEVESSASGVVRQHLVDQGAVVPVGTPIAVVGGADEKIEAAAPAAQKKPAAPKADAAPAPVSAPAAAPVASAGGRILASPLAKRMAAERRVDLTAIRGSGPGGRIVRRDIEAALAGAAPAAIQTVAPVVPVRHDDEVVPASKLRQAIARRMTESKQQVPHFYVTHEFDIDKLMSVRADANAALPENEKLSVNDFIVKAAALALRQFPNLNASWKGDGVVRHGQVNIGIAVAVEGGLLTIVCRDADQKPLRAIAAEVKTLAARARDGKVRPDDIEGSTFSISNLGMFDVENFLAIVNPPEAAILAVGSGRQVPVVAEGAVRPGWRMKATISVDHRASDGAEAARFMQALAALLENPVGLLIH